MNILQKDDHFSSLLKKDELVDTEFHENVFIKKMKNKYLDNSDILKPRWSVIDINILQKNLNIDHLFLPRIVAQFTYVLDRSAIMNEESSWISLGGLAVNEFEEAHIKLKEFDEK